MNNNAYFQRKPLALALSAALIPCAMMVEPVQAAQQDAIEEVMVTATRRSESLQDIPLNIAAVSGELLEQQRLLNLADIARTVPGMSLNDKGSRDTGNNIVVRGLTTSNGGDPGAGPYSSAAVATYMGEIPLFVDLMPTDLERVEVLLGPQGTLYGSGTLAGAVRYIPTKPQFDSNGGEVRSRVFQLDEAESLSYAAGATLNLAVADNFALRANVDVNDDSGFIDYDYIVREAGVSNPQPDFTNAADVAANLRSVEDADAHKTTAFRLAARWAPLDTVDTVLSYWHQEYETGGRTITNRDALAHLTDIGEYTSALRFEEPQQRETELLSLEVTADLGFAELTSASGMSKIDEEGQRDQTDLLLDFNYGYEEFPAFAAFTRETLEFEGIVQELRLVSKGDSAFNWITGLFYSKVESFDTSSEFTPGYDLFLVDIGFGVQPRPDSLEYFQVGDQERTEQAIFGEIEYAVGDVTFTLGGRFYDFEESLVSGFDLPLARTVFGGEDPNSIQPNLVDAEGEASGSLFKFNVAYDVNDDVMLYATLSEGYRIGGINPVPACSGEELGNAQALCALPNEVLYLPDETFNKEIGIRSQWLDGRLTLNGSIYHIDWTDLHVDGITANGDIPITTNASEAESSGFEMSFVALLSQSLSINGNFAYNKAELTEDVAALVRNDDVFDGDRLPASPEVSGSLIVDYQTTVLGDKALQLSYAMFYTGDVYTTVGNRGYSAVADRNGNVQPQGWGQELDAYWLHNATATITAGNLQVSAFVDNVWGKYAVISPRVDKSELRDSGDFALRSYGEHVTQPRTVGIGVNYRF